MASERSIIYKNIIEELTKKGDAGPSFLTWLKRRMASRYKIQFPTNRELLLFYHKLLKNKATKKNPILEKLLQTRAVRSLSGVAVVTVLTKPFPCPGRCLFCPNEPDMPKSYLKNEPAANRAYLTKFDPYTQVKIRLEALTGGGHPTDKIELIVLGGTWSAYPQNYQYWFIKECFRAANGKLHTANRQSQNNNFSKIRKTLKAEQKKNETAKNRIIGLTLETRPDCVTTEEIIRMRDLGATRVELGAQTIYDDILEKNNRGHNAAQIAQATKRLKDAGFKINYHVMLNLPGSNPVRDLRMFKGLFSNQNFQPDLLKIYPCSVLKTAPLYKIWQQGKYKPYGEKQLTSLLLKIKKIIPPYVRIQRIIRDIPSGEITAGSKISNLRQLIESNKICRCIRCREARGEYSPNENIVLFRQGYKASDGQEIFLSFENRDKTKLYALLRLRIPSPSSKMLPVLKNSALIREVHTYGQLVSLAKNVKLKNANYVQHKGLGKKLMTEAEKIAKKEFKLKKIAVISGVGVREYYKKLGYRLKDEYMVKEIY